MRISARVRPHFHTRSEIKDILYLSCKSEHARYTRRMSERDIFIRGSHNSLLIFTNE